MLIIRFSRVGKKNHAQYKVVLTENTYPVQGKFIEVLGSYDPHLKQAVLKDERVKHWIEKGVQCSDSAFNLLVSKGLIKDKKRKVKIRKPVEEKKEGEEAGEAKPEEAKAEEAKPEEVKTEESAEAPKEKVAGETVKEEKTEEKVEEKPEEEKSEPVVEEKKEEKPVETK